MLYVMGQIIERGGDQWRVTAITGSFIIATRSDIIGEPVRLSDIIKVMR